MMTEIHSDMYDIGWNGSERIGGTRWENGEVCRKVWVREMKAKRERVP